MRRMLFVLGFNPKGESAEAAEIKSGDLSTDLGHTNYIEGKVELLGWRYFLSLIRIY
jgi:hypothetical protein